MPTEKDTPRSLSKLREDDEFEDEVFTGVTHAALDLHGKRFSNCSFEGMNLLELKLGSCVLTDCRFTRCDLTMTKLAECSLRGVSFERTKLMGIDWSVARDLVFDVSFDTCVLSYGSFVERRMRDTSIINSVAHEADFSGANLTGADFTGTDLRDARFMRTNLTRTNLSEAHSYRISPGENTLKQTRFSIEAALSMVAELGIVVG